MRRDLRQEWCTACRIRGKENCAVMFFGSGLHGGDSRLKQLFNECTLIAEQLSFELFENSAAEKND
jgi:hypothetical protein